MAREGSGCRRALATSSGDGPGGLGAGGRGRLTGGGLGSHGMTGGTFGGSSCAARGPTATAGRASRNRMVRRMKVPRWRFGDGGRSGGVLSAIASASVQHSGSMGADGPPARDVHSLMLPVPDVGHRIHNPDVIPSHRLL